MDTADDKPKSSSIATLARGLMSILTITSSPLYRYPYRNSSEAFRGDYKRIAGDIASAFNALDTHGKSR